MSTILKALQQLEDEKRDKPELTLEQQITMTRPPESTRRRGSLVLAGSAAGGIAVALGAMYFWMDPNSATDIESQAVAASPTRPSTSLAVAPRPSPSGSAQLAQSRLEVPSTVAGSLKASAGASTQPARTASGTDSGVQVVQRLSRTPKTEIARPSPPVSRENLALRERYLEHANSADKTRGVSSARDVVSSRLAALAAKPAIDSGTPSGNSDIVTNHRTLPQSPQSPQSSPSPERSRTRPTESARAATVSEPAATQQALVSPVARAEPVKAAPTPAIVSKPATGRAVEPDHRVILRAKLPDLKVRSTVWHPQGSRRIAMVEVDAGAALELNEGDSVGPLVVESITPGGVVFSHDGVSVLHKVGR